MTIEAEARAVDSRCASSCGRLMDDSERTLFAQRSPEKSMMTGSTSHMGTEDMTHEPSLVEHEYAKKSTQVRTRCDDQLQARPVTRSVGVPLQNGIPFGVENVHEPA